MTHTSNTPASGTTRDERSDGTRPRRAAAPTRRSVRGKTTLPAAGATGRARRARIEPMAVRPLRDGRYVVETEGGTYVVDTEADTCTCPDSAIRGNRCKHGLRVDLEIERGEVPPPGERASACAVCGDRVFVPMGAAGPQLCRRHALAPGDLARDRETGKPLLVVADTGERADEATTGEGRAIADYETNANYGAHEPVFEAVYVDSFEAVRDLDDFDDEKRYGFPASRLRRVDRDEFRSGPRGGREAAQGGLAARDEGDPNRGDRGRLRREGGSDREGRARTRQQTLPESASAAV